MPTHHRDYLIFWLIPLIFFAIFYFRSFFLTLFFAFIIGLSIQSWALVIHHRLKVPFLVSVVLFYLIFAFIVMSFVYLGLPIIIHQIQNLTNKLPQIYLNLIQKTGDNLPDVISETLKQSPGLLIDFGPDLIFKIFGGFFSTLLITVLSFYIAVNQEFLPNLIKIFAKSNEAKLLELLDRVRKRFANWLGGEIFLMISVGLATYIVVLIIGIPYPFLISFAAGLFEIIPIIGPFISAVIASLITLSFEPDKILLVIASFIAIQQLENHFLVPLIMKKAISLPPLITLTGVVIGGKLGGVLGVLITVPALAFVLEIYRAFYPKKEIPQV